jgi:hypothetical protein
MSSARWTGKEDSRWNNPKNWNTQAVPGQDDDVSIASGPNVSFRNVEADSVSVRSLRLGNQQRDSNPASLKVRRLSVASELTLNGGRLTGLVSIPAGARARVAGPNPKVLHGLTLENAGRMTVGGTGDLELVQAVIKNTGRLEVTSKIRLAYMGGATSRLENTGKLVVAAAGELLVDGIDVHSTKAVELKGAFVVRPSSAIKLEVKGFTGPGRVLLDSGGSLVTFVGNVSVAAATRLEIKSSLVRIEKLLRCAGPVVWAGGRIDAPQAGRTLALTPSSTLDFAGPNPKVLHGLTLENAGRMTVGGTGALELDAGAEIRNKGTVEIGAGASVQIASTSRLTQTAGELRLLGARINSHQPVHVDAGVITGDGVIDGALRLRGIVRPAGATRRLEITGNLELGRSGTVDLELRTTGFDTLAVGQRAVLDGLLEVRRGAGLALTPGERLAVMPYGSRTGHFRRLRGFAAAGNETLNAVYDAGELAVAVIDLVSQVMPGDRAGLTILNELDNMCGRMVPAGHPPTVHDGLRTIDEQIQLYARGRTFGELQADLNAAVAAGTVDAPTAQRWIDFYDPNAGGNPLPPGPTVTWTFASRHLVGDAADVIHRVLAWNAPPAFWSALNAAAAAEGLQIGPPDNDLPHVQRP